MDPEVVERFRNARFNLVKRGYDRDEVQRFLDQWADWLESLDDEPAAGEVAQRELERVGEQTAGVLAAAGEAAATITADADEKAAQMLDEAKVQANVVRVDAERYAEGVRSEADDYAQRNRGQADAYSAQRRAEADEVAEQARADAELTAGERLEGARAEAEALVREGREKRESLETVIADLVSRRDRLLDEIESIAGALAGTASEHRTPAADATTQALATSDEEDEDGSGDEADEDLTLEAATLERPNGAERDPGGSS